MECTSNSYISVNLVIKNISIWKSLGLDYILKQGERIFRLVRVSQSLAVKDLPLDIIIDGHSVSKKMLAHEVICLQKEMTHLKVIGVTVNRKETTG